MKQRGDGMSSGYLDRQPHKTYAGKHTLTHSAPVEGEGVRPVRDCMKQINISTPSAARWISMIVYFHRLSFPFFFLDQFTPPQTFLSNDRTIFAHMCVVDKFGHCCENCNAKRNRTKLKNTFRETWAWHIQPVGTEEHTRIGLISKQDLIPHSYTYKMQFLLEVIQVFRIEYPDWVM